MTTPPIQPIIPPSPAVPPTPTPISPPQPHSEAKTLDERSDVGAIEPITQKKSPLIVILLTLLILATSAATYFYSQSRNNTPSLADTTQPKPTASAIASPSADPTTDWQTYTNNKHNYSFKYPNNWQISFEDTYQYSNVQISSSIDSEKSISAFYFTNIENSNIPNHTQNFIIDKNSRIMLSFAHCTGGPGGPDCGGAISQEDINIFTQILQTFQFTDQVSDELIMLDQIKQSLFSQIKEYGAKFESIDLNTAKVEGAYAQGRYTIDGVGGAIWWAVQENGSWSVVEIAQEPPSCSIIEQYSFPSTIMGGGEGECIE